LGLEQAGVELEGGRIVTDATMRTSAPHIYAAGDCTSPHEIVHLAVQQGETAGRNISNAGLNEAVDYRLLIQVVFTDPPIASVGLTEKEAAERGVKVLVARHPFSDHGKSLIMEARIRRQARSSVAPASAHPEASSSTKSWWPWPAG
jgi:pyruvate/2-oxoglutarate dehydrogenase complex dihydrolipoamide dehydrogenase (E3) component